MVSFSFSLSTSSVILLIFPSQTVLGFITKSTPSLKVSSWSPNDVNVPKSCLSQKERVLKVGDCLQALHQHQSKMPTILYLGKDQDETSDDRWTPLSLPAKILFPFQLAAAIGILLVLPAALALDLDWENSLRTMGTLPYEYMVFFSLLLIPRVYKYGKFAELDSTKKFSSLKSQSNDDNKKLASVAEAAIFVTTLVGSHWRAVFEYASATAGTMTQSDELLIWPFCFLVLRSFAIALVAWSGNELGKSYDRVTRPDELVQSGPYAVVRHPIYTAYLILFSSTLLTLGSYDSCVVFLTVALVFYSRRMASEDVILAETFGDSFERYREQVPWLLVPFLY